MREIEMRIQKNINIPALDRAMRARFGARISGISRAGDTLMVHVLEPADGDDDAAREVLAAHDPTEQTPEQAAFEVVRQAPARAAAIPGWATWDEQQAGTWITDNVKDLASAKVALIAMARMLVALRDAQWPGLGLDK